MLATAAVPAVLAGLAAAAALQRPRGSPRGFPTGRGEVLPPPVWWAGTFACQGNQRRPSTDGRRWGSVSPRTASVVAGLAVVLVQDGRAGVLIGLGIALGAPHFLSRLEPAAVRAERARLVADLPLALDLLAACLVGGAAPAAAATSVGRAVGGPCGARLTAVAAALAVGIAGEEAWSALAGPSGPAGPDPLAPAARALSRAAQGGAPVAAAVARLAGQARDEARSRGQAAAHRAGVLAVAPLGLCFLPAFVLLGVVPIVAGLAGPALAGL